MKYLKAYSYLIALTLNVSAYAQPQDDFMIPDNANEAQAPNAIDPNVMPANPTPDFMNDPNAAQNSLVPQGTDPLLEGFFEDTSYSPQDKRDPFFPYLMLQKMRIVDDRHLAPKEPLQNFALNELKVVGIIWDVGKPKALVVDPSGKSYIITENAKMGKELGYVAAIREGEVLVVEEVYDPQGRKSFVTKILKLSMGTQSALAQ